MLLNIVKRHIDVLFSEWYNARKDKLLFITGTRSIGKTFEAKRFAKKTFEYMVYIDLNDINYDLFHKLLYFNIVCPANKDVVIVIDNIHLNKALYKLITMFYQFFNFSIILIGDTFKSNLYNLDCNDANVYHVVMHPVSFIEFVDTLGISTGNTELMINAYNVYRFLGGYPEVISTFLSTKSYTDCNYVFQEILKNIVSDFVYNRTKIIRRYGNVYLNSFKLNYSDNLISNFCNFIAINDYSVVAYLYLSGLIDYSIVFDGKNCIVTNNKRYYINDIGLLSYIYKILDYDKSSYKGTTTECYVFNDLIHNIDSKYYNCKLYYILYDNYELDFAMIDNKSIVGIEVKTNRGHTKSLNFFKMINLIQTGIKIGMYNKTYNYSNNFYTHPVYKTFELNINNLSCV